MKLLHSNPKDEQFRDNSNKRELMKQEIMVKYANVCGKDLYYPNSEGAKMMISMLKSGSGVRKAFVKDDLTKLEHMGHEVKVLLPKIEVTYEA